MPRLPAPLLSLAAGLLVLAGVFFLAPREAWDPARWRPVAWPWIGAALLAYAGVYAARALRFLLLLELPRGSLPRLARIVALHNLANQWLPARSGELVFLHLARRRLRLGLGRAVSALLAARLLDAAAVTGIFLAGAAALPARSAPPYRLWAAGALALVLLALWSLPGLLERVAAATRHRGPPAARRFAEALLFASPALRRGRRPAVLAVTLGQWSLTLAAVCSLARAADLGADLAAGLLGSAGLSLALLLPINAPGNLGTFEAGWVFGFGLAGVPMERAVPAALIAHASLVAFTALLALPALRAEGPSALQTARAESPEKENLADAP